MKKTQDRKVSKVLGILSIIFGLISPAVGFILGIVGISIKKSEKHYTRDIVLNTIGIIVSVINFLLGFLLLLAML